MKIFSTSQVRTLDQYTIAHEPITSIDLMERAANTIFEAFTETFAFNRPVLVLAGPGNNGGDALALVRKLLRIRVETKVILLHNGKLSPDCEANKQRLNNLHPDVITEQQNQFIAPEIPDKTIIIDGLFGSGLSRPLEGMFADAVNWINQTGCEVMSIDIPSGLQGENNPDLNVPIVRANHTFSLQFPKLSFFFPETGVFIGNESILNIGIHPDAIAKTESRYFLLTIDDIQNSLKKRPKFSHKGTYGHALIFAGSKDMAGAAVLSSKAAMRTGAGLVTVHSAACNRTILQTAVPEVIFQSDEAKNFISNISNTEKYNAIAIGPGIGMYPETAELLKQILENQQKPCVLDADALNIISQNKELLNLIPENSILTPHPKEFERLFGKTSGSFERINLASEISQKRKLIIVLKGAYTQIFLPDGNIFFNSTGNQGMATAGSGDVLTGIIVSLLAQGYSPENATKIGVYLHGLAGDVAINHQSFESLMASDIIYHLPNAFKRISK
ncbi:MAG: NAD(P)H-hydrate dehydratase [Paludibacter sp.]|nr:NAD(P)H-hydrate dehydratase [Paludibacter sp.]